MTKKMIITGLLSLSFSSSLWAADPASQPPAGKGMPMHELTAEQRAKMADNMDKMAACLRSDKTMETCHTEMKANCEANMDSCPMMGPHHMGMGKMRMQNQKKSKPETK